MGAAEENEILKTTHGLFGIAATSLKKHNKSGFQTHPIHV